MKRDEELSTFHYMPISEQDEKWGIVCTTCGSQFIKPNSSYPSSQHPESYYFSQNNGRTLNEYQLIFITKGEGVFESASHPLTKVTAGTMIMLFPGEWHNYYPNKESGWMEWWVGFRGTNIDSRMETGFFTEKEPIIYIGNSNGIENLYQEIIRLSREEPSNFQLLISSIVLHILGSVIFKKSVIEYASDINVETINKAKSIMRNNLNTTLSAQNIAQQLNVSYSWLRHKFKEYVGMSPSQYSRQLKHNKAKELLSTTTLSISDVSYTLGFENICQFSTFFKSSEGLSPRDFRNKYNNKSNQTR